MAEHLSPEFEDEIRQRADLDQHFGAPTVRRLLSEIDLLRSNAIAGRAPQPGDVATCRCGSIIRWKLTPGPAGIFRWVAGEGLSSSATCAGAGYDFPEGVLHTPTSGV